MGGTLPPKTFPTPGAIGQSQGANLLVPANHQKTMTALTNAPSMTKNPYADSAKLKYSLMFPGVSS
jgi:hypothetical protein